jgi:two-component system chemotaxis response regulator CheB
MRKIRVLVVDDSVVVRRLISDVLVADPAIEVAGIAATGRIALTKIPQLNPDLVTLDVEMPDLDGLGTLREIRKAYPKLPVIMFSTLTERGAAATVDALTCGANDYVTKPANVGSVTAAMEQVTHALIPKIKALCGACLQGAPLAAPSRAFTPVNGAPRALVAPAVVTFASPSLVEQRVEVLAIATSTGGPNALAALLPALPGNLPVPVVIVQHMPPMFTRLLAEHLTAKCAFGVSEAVSGEKLYANHAWIAPGDHHMIVAQNSPAGVVVRTHQGPPENSCRPAADVLFRSVADVFGARALAVVLTGMGQDGMRGSESIRSKGGRVLAQDEASSVVWGMAGAVARAGLADGVWPLDQLGALILRRLQVGRPDWRPMTVAPPAAAAALN